MVRAGLVKEYGRLMGGLVGEVDRRLGPMEKRVDGVEGGKGVGRARVVGLGNSLDFYRKKVKGMEKEIVGLEERNGKLKDS